MEKFWARLDSHWWRKLWSFRLLKYIILHLHFFWRWIFCASKGSCFKWCNNWINIFHRTSSFNSRAQLVYYNTISKHELIIFTTNNQELEPYFSARYPKRYLVLISSFPAWFFANNITYLYFLMFSLYLHITKIKKMLVA